MNGRQTVQELLFACLRAAVTGMALPEQTRSLLTEERLKTVCTVAKEHDLAHLVAYAIEEAGVPMTAETAQVVHRLRMTAVYRFELQRFETERIRTLFEEADLPFLLLKGAVLRDCYPEPWMRTGCDIDLLVQEEDLARAGELLTERLGYRKDGENEHDVQFYAPNGTHLELHFTLCVQLESADELLRDAWKYGDCVSHRLIPAFHLFYFLAHTAKHVLVGGCGIRPLLDLFLLRRAGETDEAETLALCRQGGLERFCKATFRLSEVWFSGLIPTQEDILFADYLLGAGVYGNVRNRVAIGNAKQGGRLRYLLSRLFPPAEKIRQLYPSAGKLPFLLPFYYVRRMFRFLLPNRRKSLVRECRLAVGMSDGLSAKAAELLERLGLR